MRRAVGSAVAVLTLVLAAAPASAVQTTLVAADDTWRYLDDGSDQGTAWRAPAFADAGWKSGPAQLGYGDGDEQTVVGFGPDAANKFATTYFRRTFTATGVAAFVRVDLRLMVDDGAVVYLNGTEIARPNMPAGPVTATTLASTPVGTTGEAAWAETAVPLGLLVEGTNVLAVEVHQATPASTDLSFDLELLGSTTAVRVTRGPYLQRGTPTGVVVRWRTSAPTDAAVHWGTSPGALDQVATDPAVGTEHAVAVEGLAPATRYTYSVGTTAGPLVGDDATHQLVTAPVAGRPAATRIWVVGDSGTADVNALAVRNAYEAFTATRPADLWLMLGDNAYPSGTDAQYQAAVFDVYPRELRTTVLWPTFGNHDALSAFSATQSGPYYDIFTMPTEAEAGGLRSGTEAYYAFDWANIHFICLDSHESDRSPGGAMLTWLRADLEMVTTLAEGRPDWIIAFWHHPPYSKGSHDSDVEDRLVQMRQNVLPILEEFGVDLVLAGHSHAYERSMLLDGHYGLSTTLTAAMILDPGNGRADGTGIYRKASPAPTGHEGAVYAVAGSSGQASGGALNHPAMVLSLSELGSLLLDVDDSVLSATFLRSDGAIRDTFTIAKGLCPPAPRTDCRATKRSVLAIRDAKRDKGDTVTWQWRGGAATSLGDLGDPTATTRYALCVWDADGRVIRLHVPAGGGRWRARGAKGFRYRDRKGSADGARDVLLRAGGAARALVAVKAAGPALDTPRLPVTAPLTAQWVNDAGTCWEARFAKVKRNRKGRLRAQMP
jgi:hypothetical protein